MAPDRLTCRMVSRVCAASSRRNKIGFAIMDIWSSMDAHVRKPVANNGEDHYLMLLD